MRTVQVVVKQGVALTRRNDTGPPYSAAALSHTRPANGPPAGIVTDHDRRQQAKQYWPIRRASNKRALRFNNGFKIVNTTFV